jgi:hypothetical protein
MKRSTRPRFDVFRFGAFLEAARFELLFAVAP